MSVDRPSGELTIEPVDSSLTAGDYLLDAKYLVGSPFKAKNVQAAGVNAQIAQAELLHRGVLALERIDAQLARQATEPHAVASLRDWPAASVVLLNLVREALVKSLSLDSRPELRREIESTLASVATQLHDESCA